VNRFVLFLILSFAACAAHAQLVAQLLDAPQPSIARPAEIDAQSPPQSAPVVVPPGKPAPQSGSPIEHASYEKRKWAQYVDPGERVPRLSGKDKMNFWLHQEKRVWSAFPAFLSAGYGQLTDTPHYGSDSGAFGDRLSAAFLRQATMRFFSNSLFPALDREDPRYFRRARGSYGSRAAWAAKQSITDERDSGRRSFNVSNIFGHLAACAITPLYYPAPSRNTGVVMETWATSIAGSAGNNLFLEFWPDVVNRLHRK
jgi:hypothetical protein